MTAGNALIPALVGALASRALRVIDLTHTLSPDFPNITLPPEVGQRPPFSQAGNLPLRRARRRLVLEQLHLRRAHRHAFRRAGALDHRPRPARRRIPTPSRRSG